MAALSRLFCNKIGMYAVFSAKGNQFFSVLADHTRVVNLRAGFGKRDRLIQSFSTKMRFHIGRRDCLS